MIIEDSVNGSELDISEGSHFFCRDEDGKEIFKDCTELDLETKEKLLELANQVEDIMDRGATLIK